MSAVRSSPEFCAIDFETANRYPNSACSVAVVRVRGTRVVAARSWLVRPPFRRFDFTGIHGITWEAVRRSPTFADLWGEIAPHLDRADFVAAHNAPFDRRVLEACARWYDIELPPIEFVCTMKLARQTWGLRPTTLKHVADFLGIPLEHHVAASDARACAEIVIRALGRRGGRADRV
jgi:DNA polymerase-3 subunit epsilon